MRRRSFLKSTAGLIGTYLTRGAAAVGRFDIPVIDTHIHLFDTARPGGVPWPLPSDHVLYRPSLPERYQPIAKEFGIVGAIAIEVSPLPKDNDWLLHTAQRSPLMVGIVGDLIPGDPEYARELERLHKNPLFLGIRYGNLWQRNLVADIQKPGFLDGIKLLSQAGLVMDSANPNPELIGVLSRLAELVPELTIVIDHLPHLILPTGLAEKSTYLRQLQTLGAAQRVFVKLSEIPAERNGRVPTEASFYKETLDSLWQCFGEDKVLYGSDWPNSDHAAPYGTGIGILRQYVADKSRSAQEKLFWRNSIAAYRWRRRSPEQPALSS
jgi:L-fuconolactonase